MLRVIYPLNLIFLVSAMIGCGGSSQPAGKNAAKTGEGKLAIQEVVKPLEWKQPLFEDVTGQSRIAFTYRNGETTANHFSILESLGGGVGVIDFDRDGLMDVFLAGGGEFGGPDKKTIQGLPCALYKNTGNCVFLDVTAKTGVGQLGGEKPWFYNHGVAVGDYDRDGWPDILVTGWGAVALLKNVAVNPMAPGEGRRFEEVTIQAGLGQGFEWATSVAFGDLDGDGFPDLYVCQYVDWSWRKHPLCYYDGKTPDVCPPKNFDGLAHKVFRNNTRGGFEDVSMECGLKGGGPGQSKGLGVVMVDVDGNRKADIYVANDTTDNFFYLNQSVPGKIKLEERGLVSGLARDDRGNANGSMGVDAGDPQRTGKAAFWVTNYENELPMLYRNDSVQGRLLYTPFSTAAGIGAIGQKYVGWGTGFLDADLDGWEDLFVANGHAVRHPAGNSAKRLQRPVLLMNQNGQKFRDAGDQIGAYGEGDHLGRGVGFADLDNDGHMDLVLNPLNEPVTVLRGVGGKDRQWLGVHLVAKDNGCIVGAKSVWESTGKRQTRFAKGGGSYASSGDRRMVFGLGQETAGTLRVTWASGLEQAFENLPVDRYYRILEGTPAVAVEQVQGK